MSNTTISADEGHFELAKSICMANNHIHLQLQIIQPFLPDEAGYISATCFNPFSGSQPDSCL